jgi:hypothetical protein
VGLLTVVDHAGGVLVIYAAVLLGAAACALYRGGLQLLLRMNAPDVRHGPTTAPSSWGEVLAWFFAGPCAIVVGGILSSIGSAATGQQGVRILLSGGILLGVGVVARRRGFRQLAAYLAGIVAFIAFMLAALSLLSR